MDMHLVGTKLSQPVSSTSIVVTLQERPQHLQPRVLLLRNLMRQSEGREGDVPALALQALKDAGTTQPIGVNPSQHTHAF